MSFESCQPSTRYISPSRETAQGGAAAVNIYFQFCVDIALQYCRGVALRCTAVCRIADARYGIHFIATTISLNHVCNIIVDDSIINI